MQRKTVLFRGEYPYKEMLCLLGPWKVEVAPLCLYPARPEAVVLDNPLPDELRAEAERMMIRGIRARIIVVGDLYTHLAVRASCPYADAVADDEGAEGVAEALKGRRHSAISLTSREKELLVRMRMGPTNKELSLSMAISERTVRRIKEGIFRKTGLVSGEQLAVFSLYLDQYSQLLTYLG